MAIHLAKEQVKAAALAAYEKHELQFQTDKRHSEICFYSAPCAIGAALSLPQRAELDTDFNSMGVKALNTKGVITTDDLDWIQIFQNSHDALVRPQPTLEALNAFRSMLELPLLIEMPACL